MGYFGFPWNHTREPDQMLWFACFTELSGNYFLSLLREIKQDWVANNGLVLKISLNCKRFNMHDTYLSFNGRGKKGTQSAGTPAGAIVPLCPKITIKASIKYQQGSYVWLCGVILSSASLTSAKKRDHAKRIAAGEGRRGHMHTCNNWTLLEGNH